MLELKRIYWSRRALRLAMFAAVVWLTASGVLALVPGTAHVTAVVPGGSPVGVVRQLFEGVLAAAIPGGIVVLGLAVAAAIIRGRDLRRRDPVRRFTRKQCREGMARANGQCEMEAGFRRRCSRPAEHGDHFYPWSKGGSTSLQNFVAACSRCNRAKGAQIPSPGQQERIERRRAAYVPPGAAVVVGERQPLS